MIQRGVTSGLHFSAASDCVDQARIQHFSKGGGGGGGINIM